MLAAALSIACPCAGQTANKQVLVLSSYHQGYAWSDSMISGLQEVFADSDLPVELHVEHMDTKRHHADRLFGVLEDLYRRKFRDIRFDVVVACDESALSFVMARRGLFQDAPVVFCGINNYRDDLIAEQTDITGVAEDFDLDGTLGVALDLHPGTRHVAIVTAATPTGQATLKRARRAYARFPQVDFVELAHLTVESLEDRLASLPANTVIIRTPFLRDAAGRVFSVAEGARLVESFTDLPVYTMWDFSIGPKTVGGIMTDGRLQGSNAAKMTLRILRGQEPDDIEVMRRCPTQPIFNYPALVRFGIRPSELPKGSTVLNRPVSFYERHERVIWLASTVVAGLVVVVAVLATNIALRRRAELRLRASEREKDLILSTVPDLMTYQDADCKLIWASPTALRAMGLPNPEAARGKSCHLLMGDDESPRPDCPIAESLRTGEPVERELTLKNGRTFWASAQPVHGDDGEVVGCVQVARDITARRQAQRERRRLEAQVQHAQKLESLGVLAGGIAHDFNNLLVGVLGNADLALADLRDQPDVRQSLEEVKKAARRASDLTNQLLAYSGKGRFVVERVNLNETVAEMADLLKVSRSPNTTIRFDFDEELPPVQADASQMRQVVMNLITNASDAVGDEEGTITIRTGVKHCTQEYLALTYLAEERPAGDYVFIEVSDSGCGMDEETRRRLFDPFFTTKFAGRGLGLAAVLGIVRGHEGAIELHSAPGEGTTFRVLLPRCDEEQDAEAPAISPPAERESGKGTALIVDDEESVRRVAAMMFQRLGFEVLQAADGRAGVETLRDRPDEIDIVLLDMTMPGLDGKATFEQMRRIRPDIRVVLSSGFNEQDATNRFAAEGLAGFVQKPFDLETLEKAVTTARGT